MIHETWNWTRRKLGRPDPMLDEFIDHLMVPVVLGAFTSSMNKARNDFQVFGTALESVASSMKSLTETINSVSWEEE